jgi:hypothetical protein
MAMVFDRQQTVLAGPNQYVEVRRHTADPAGQSRLSNALTPCRRQRPQATDDPLGNRIHNQLC